MAEAASRAGMARPKGLGERNADMMWKRKIALFSRSRQIEAEIEEFLQKFSESALLYKMAISTYLRDGPSPAFEEKVVRLSAFESRNDALRRSIEAQLYKQTLIPESRGDVLGLLETLDQVLGIMEGGLYAFSIEKPDIPQEFSDHYQDLVDAVVQSVECLVLASRQFFRNIDGVSDHIYKVMLFEKEADKIGTALKHAIFDSDRDLAQKMQLKCFAEYIDDVADGAEDVADRLGIYAIKRAF